MSITVQGTLVKDADVRVVGIDDYVLFLRVGVGGGNHKFEAKVFFGKTQQDRSRAIDMAAKLRRGMPALVKSNGLRWCDDHDEARFICLFCSYASVDGIVLPIT